jgi:hypothetical protein
MHLGIDFVDHVEAPPDGTGRRRIGDGAHSCAAAGMAANIAISPSTGIGIKTLR